MATANERIPVLVTSQEKTRIARLARDANMSMGEFLRRAASSFRPNEDDALLEGMINQMLNATAQASAAIDDAQAFVESSNKRIADMEAKRRG